MPPSLSSTITSSNQQQQHQVTATTNMHNKATSALFTASLVITFAVAATLSPLPLPPTRLTPPPRRATRSARTDLSWVRNRPFGIVFVYSPFDFSSVETSAMTSAASQIRSSSCIPVVLTPYTPQTRASLPPNYVYITRRAGEGCQATIGMAGGPQTLNLDPTLGCPSHTPSIIHEMIHSLGYDHEHNRPDRDNYVHINYNNVKTNNINQFNVKPHVRAVGPYDFYSIMHYGKHAFAREPYADTIVSKVGGHGVPEWSPSVLSPTDKKKIQFITGCNNPF